jgi:LAO/AO transport system kinase
MPAPPDTEQLLEGIKHGERAALAGALNLLDDRREQARSAAAALLAGLSGENTQTSRLIGITGPPGAGKSSLTAALIKVWRQRDLSVGILAVDPSSPISGGALLGDRLRMMASAEDDGVFIRSLACRDDYGGLSAEVWPMAQVMMAGFDVTVIETVGVGQREIDVSGLCDTSCYVAQPGSGDSIQFLKAGILEVPQILVVNKSDMGAVARRTLAELGSALEGDIRPDGWQAVVLPASATENTGIATLADSLEAHHQHLLDNNLLLARRRGYHATWITKRLREEFGSHGLQLLGGESALSQELQQTPDSLFRKYDTVRQKILTEMGTDLSLSP